jgi:O-antigen/teichoic acid export membrane protein
MGKYSRLGKNTLLVFIGNTGAKLITFLMLPFYTRWLSVEDYGITDIINVYVSLLLGLSNACLADALYIFVKDKSFDKQKSFFSSGLFFSFLMLLVTAVLFELVNRIFTFNNMSNSFTSNSWYIYIMLVITFLQQYMQQFARGLDKMKLYSATGIILTISTAMFSFFIIPIWGIYGYVLALILANFVAAIYSFFGSSAYKYFSWKSINKISCIEMLKYSIPLIPNSMMVWLLGALNRPLLENLSGIHSVGIFAIANKFPSIISMVAFSIFGVSWQISVFEEFGNEGYENFFNNIFRMIVTTLFLIFFCIALFNDLIIRIFTTPEYYEASYYVSILTLGAIFLSIAGLIGGNFSAARKSKYFFFSTIWGAITSVIGNMLLIKRFGIFGASIVVVFAYGTMAISRIIYAWKYVKINNISTYLLMILIAIAVIIVNLYIKINFVKYILIFLLFALFICINYELKSNVLKVYKMLKLKL